MTPESFVGLRERLRQTIVEAHFNHRPQSWVSKADGRVWHGARPIEECYRCAKRMSDLFSLIEQVRAAEGVVEAARPLDADITWLTDLLNEWHTNSAHAANCVLCPTISAQIVALGHRNVLGAAIDTATLSRSAVRPGEGSPWATVPSQQKTTPE